MAMGAIRSTKGGLNHLLFDWSGLACFANKKQKIVSCHAAESKPVKQEVNGAVILSPFSIPLLKVMAGLAVSIQTIGSVFRDIHEQAKCSS
jgi:hypothetical protein